jgi:hypothetical protein
LIHFVLSSQLLDPAEFEEYSHLSVDQVAARTIRFDIAHAARADFMASHLATPNPRTLDMESVSGR